MNDEERWAEALPCLESETDSLVIVEHHPCKWDCEGCGLVIGTEALPPCQRACPQCGKVFTLLPLLLN